MPPVRPTRLLTILLLPLLLAFFAVGTTRTASAVCGVSFPATAANESELNTAIGCFNGETSTDVYTITLTADIDLTASTTAIDNTAAGVVLAIEGGGFAVDGQGISGVRPFQIAGNTAVTMNELTVTGGSVTGNGGGILNSGTLTITASTISGNTMTSESISPFDGGGGVANFGTLTLINSTVSGNNARSFGAGGGIGNRGGTLRLVNSTVSNNTTEFSSGSIAADGGTLTFHNSIIANPGGCILDGGATATASHSLFESASNACGIATGTDGNVIGQDPALAALADNGGPTQTHALGAGSPAIDLVPYGVNGCGTTITSDQRGESRLFTLSCDAGAYESQSVAASCFVESSGDTVTDFAGDAGAVQAGIDAAGENGAVKVAGTCTGVSVTESLTQTGYISTGLSLSGGYTATNWLAAADPDTYPTTLDADGSGRVLYLTGSEPITVTGLILTGGYWDLLESNNVSGGGIYNSADSVVIRDSQIVSNTAITAGLQATRGGGVYQAGGALYLSSVEVTDNVAESPLIGGIGGGLYSETGEVVLLDSRVAGNSAQTPDGDLFSGGRGGGLVSDGQAQILSSTIEYNASGENGGGLINGGVMTVTDSLVQHNSAGNNGGGLYHAGGSVEILISNSKFFHNSANAGGGLALYDGIAVIDSILVAENEAEDGDGIEIWDAVVTISDSIVRQNTATRYSGGGIITGSGTTTIENSAILSNTATLVGGGINNGYGDAVWLTLINSTVSGNQVLTSTLDTYYGGGGIGHWTDDTTSLTLLYSTIANNSAPNLAGRDGLYVYGTVNVTGSILAGNGTENCAGRDVTFVSGGYNVEDTDTCGLSADGDQPNTDPLLGSLAENGGDTQTHGLQAGSPAIDLVPYGMGGCGTAITTDQRGESRLLTLSCDAGAYEALDETPLCFVESNGDAATDFAGDAGAVQAGIDAVAYGGGTNGAVKVAGTCTGVSVTESLTQTGYISTGLSLSGGYTVTNWLADADPDTYPTTLDADSSGRVLYLTGSEPITVTGLILTGGVAAKTSNAYYRGGGIYNGATSVVISNSQIVSNAADSSVVSQGGGIYNSGGTSLELRSIDLSYNQAASTFATNGGGLFNDGGAVELIESVVSHNTSDYYGGAVYNQASGSLVISQTTVAENVAQSGAGLYLSTGAVLVQDSNLSNNDASGNGGAFYAGSDDAITFRDCEISGNSAGVSGGGGLIARGSVTVDTCAIRANSSASGGALYAYGGTVDLKESSVVSNSATAFGGGIANTGGHITLTSSTVLTNTADLLGGGIANLAGLFASDSFVTLTNSTISGNQVLTSTADLGGILAGGGGLYNYDDGASMYILYSTIATNSAPNLSGRDGVFNSAAADITASILDNDDGNCFLDGGTLSSGGYNVSSDATCGLTGADDLSSTDPLLGDLAEESDTWVHTPAKSSPAVDHIPVGAAGCAVTYSTDQLGTSRPQNLYCDSGAIEITNQTPTAAADSYTTGADETLTVSAAGILANDSDPDGDSLSALLSVGPTNGSLALNSDGGFVYTPTVGFAGVDRFTYQATDGGLSAAAEVTITVGSATVPDIALNGPAWNLFGWPLQASYAISEGLQSIDGSYATVYGYESDDGSDPWKVHDTSLPEILNDLAQFEFGHGYWISTTQSVTVTLSTLGSSRAAHRFDGSLPPPPATLWGRTDGGDSEVTVTIDGVVCGRGIVTAGWYRVHVATDAERPGCGANGRTVAVESGSGTRSLAWPGAGTHRLNLTQIRLYLPSVQADGGRAPAPPTQAEVEFQLHLPSVER